MSPFVGLENVNAELASKGIPQEAIDKLQPAFNGNRHKEDREMYERIKKRTDEKSDASSAV